MRTVSTASCRIHPYVIIREFLHYIFNTEQEDPTDTQDFSSVKLPTQAMTYPQGRFQQLILVSPGTVVPAPPSTRAQKTFRVE